MTDSLAKIGFTCAIAGHEHADAPEAGECIQWVMKNWLELRNTGLPIRDDLRAAWDEQMGLSARQAP